MESMIIENEILNLIFILGNDSDAQDVLNDSDIMKTVKSVDVTALMNNPKFMKACNKSSIQEIQKKVGN